MPLRGLALGGSLLIRDLTAALDTPTYRESEDGGCRQRILASPIMRELPKKLRAICTLMHFFALALCSPFANSHAEQVPPSNLKQRIEDPGLVKRRFEPPRTPHPELKLYLDEQDKEQGDRDDATGVSPTSGADRSDPEPASVPRQWK